MLCTIRLNCYLICYWFARAHPTQKSYFSSFFTLLVLRLCFVTIIPLLLLSMCNVDIMIITTYPIIIIAIQHISMFQVVFGTNISFLPSSPSSPPPPPPPSPTTSPPPEKCNLWLIVCWDDGPSGHTQTESFTFLRNKTIGIHVGDRGRRWRGWRVVAYHVDGEKVQILSLNMSYPSIVVFLLSMWPLNIFTTTHLPSHKHTHTTTTADNLILWFTYTHTLFHFSNFYF